MLKETELLKLLEPCIFKHGYASEDGEEGIPIDVISIDNLKAIILSERLIISRPLDALVSRNFGGVRFHKISPPRNNPSKRIPKHNDIINEVGNYFLKPNERLDLDFTNSEISDKEVGVIRTLITSKFNVHTKYKNRVLQISQAKNSG